MTSVDALVQLGASLGLILASAIVVIWRSYKGGKLGSFIARMARDRRNAELERKIDCVQETVDEINANVQQNTTQLEQTNEAIYLFHRDDVAMPDREFRKRLGVDTLPSDIVRQRRRRRDDRNDRNKEEEEE